MNPVLPVSNLVALRGYEFENVVPWRDIFDLGDTETSDDIPMTNAQPDYGDRVMYYDQDGDEHHAIVLEPIPDAEYVTVAVADGDPREGYVGTGWTVETSVYPHADLGEEYTSTAHAFTPGW